MPNTFNNSTFSGIYRDDYDPADGYHRILFNSGRPVQARELTQLQTILQEQITRFGKNIFLDGAALNPKSGGATLQKIAYVRLNDDGFNGTPASSLEGLTFTGTPISGVTNGLKFKVVKAVEATQEDPATLYGIYVDADQDQTTADDQTSSLVYQAGQEITSGDNTFSVRNSLVGEPNPAGTGIITYTTDAEFFIQGYFVYTIAQSYVLSKYTSVGVDARLGFDVVLDVITTSDDDALYDNQGATPNRAAPGADRFRIRLLLTTYQDSQNRDTFVPFATIRNSEIVQIKEGTNDYNEIERRMALRQNDTTGNFVANPFRIKYTEGDSVGELKLQMSGSQGGSNPVAFVDGFRLELKSDRFFDIDKPRSTEQVDAFTTIASYGNYFEALDSGMGFWNGNGGRVFVENNLYKGDGTPIGTARIRSVDLRTDGTYRVHVFDLNIDQGETLRDVRYVGQNTTDNYIEVSRELTVNGVEQAYISEASNNTLLFPVIGPRVQEITQTTFRVQQEFNATSSGNAFAISAPTNETFEDPSDWIIINKTKDSVEPIDADSQINITATQANFSSMDYDDEYLVLAYLRKQTASSHKNKERKNVWVRGSYNASTQTIDLSSTLYDGIQLISVFDSDSDGSNITSRIRFDGGQRDNFYSNIKLDVNPATTLNAGANRYLINLEYYDHTGTGDYFCANSYIDSAKDPEFFRVPTYVDKTGFSYRLTNCLDFRPKLTANNADYFRLPPNEELINYTVKFYEGRVDKICLGYDKSKLTPIVTVVKGSPSLSPQEPETPDSNLHLYTVRYGGNTLSPSDVRITTIKHKRYRMKDITDLEDRITLLEETTSLSFLEQETQNTAVFASDGSLRSKTGFFIENFNQGWANAATDFSVFPPIIDEALTASIDPASYYLYPKLGSSSNRILWDSDNSNNSNVVRRGETLMLDYISVLDSDLVQDKISNFINVNPYNVFTGEGAIYLSPDNDQWVETRRIADNVIDGGIQINRTLSPSLNGNASWWRWGWQGTDLPQGIDPNNLTEGQELSSSLVSTRTQNEQSFDFFESGLGRPVWSITTNVVDTITNIETLREIIGDRVVQTINLPFMRNKRIFIRAEGLRPNTRYWPYFNSIDVSQWVHVLTESEAGTFTDRSVVSAEDGDIRPSLTEHPDGGITSGGSNKIITNSEGQAWFEFWLPNTAPVQDPDDVDAADTAYTTRLNNAIAEFGSAQDPRVYDAAGWKFRTGTREFKLLDVSGNNEENALSLARANYTATGTREIRQFDVFSMRNVTVERSVDENREIAGWYDPLAQTFMVNPNSGTEGVYITKVDIYIKSAPSVTDAQIPLQLQLRGVRDGTPRSGIVAPNHRKYLSASAVRSAISGMDPENYESILAHPVTFEFDEPIFIDAGREFALVLLAETDKYEVFYGKTYEQIIGRTDSRISKQPSMGSLFLSQNGSTWTPDQTSDLAYRIHTAKFKSNGTVYLRNSATPKWYAGRDNVLSLTNGSSKLRVNQQGHGFGPGDKVNLTSTLSGTFGGISSTALFNPANTVDSADVNGYTVDVGTLATSDLLLGTIQDDVAADQNIMFNKAIINIQNSILRNTNIQYQGKFMSGYSWAAIEDLATNPSRFSGTGPSDPFIRFQNGREIWFQEPKMISSAQIEQDEGVISLQIKADLSTSQRSDFGGTSGDYVSDLTPVINLQRMDSILITHFIDNQTDTPSAFANRPLNFVNETNAGGGSSFSKYVSKPVSLATGAEGLKVLIDAYRPPASDFDLYYRVADEGTDIFTVDWTEVNPEDFVAPRDFVTSPSEPIRFDEYRYLIGGIDGDLPLFVQFQLKLVMRSQNSCQIPIFNNIRAIALV